MRILVVGAIQGGTVPIGRAICAAFTRLGQDAHLLDFSDLLEEFKEARSADDFDRSYQFHVRYKTRLLEKVVECTPDVVFGLAQSPLNDTEILTELKKAGITLCYWFLEDYRLFDSWQTIASYFDHFFTIQREPFWERLRGMGCRTYHYLPAAFDPDPGSSAQGGGPAISVSFVGAPYPNRVHFFEKLGRGDFEIYGDGWNRYRIPSVAAGDRRVTESEARDVYRRSLVNINLHSSTLENGFGRGDFINPRTFELAGLGVFQVTDMRKLLPLHFNPADEIVALGSWEDMRKAIGYFLDHEEERQAYAKRAQARVLKEHTYLHRAQEILDLVS